MNGPPIGRPVFILCVDPAHSFGQSAIPYLVTWRAVVANPPPGSGQSAIPYLVTLLACRQDTGLRSGQSAIPYLVTCSHDHQA